MERDQETNNDFFQARYMSAFQMRFASADPLGNFVANTADPQSWNMCAYARGNPLAFVDPTGYDLCQYSDGTYANDPSQPDGIDAATCADLGGTWDVPTITDEVNTNNAGLQTFYIDVGWLNQWSAENGPTDPGFTFYTGTTLPPVDLTATPTLNTTLAAKIWPHPEQPDWFANSNCQFGFLNSKYGPGTSSFVSRFSILGFTPLASGPSASSSDAIVATIATEGAKIGTWTAFKLAGSAAGKVATEMGSAIPTLYGTALDAQAKYTCSDVTTR